MREVRRPAHLSFTLSAIGFKKNSLSLHLQVRTCRHTRKCFSQPLMRMWKFSKTEGLRICLALVFELCWLPFLKGQYSISNRVWSIISSLSQSRSSTTFIRVSESGSTLFYLLTAIMKPDGRLNCYSHAELPCYLQMWNGHRFSLSQSSWSV